MRIFLSIFIPGTVLILVIGNIFAWANYARDLRKEMMEESRKKMPVGRPTKRQVALLHANKLRNNRNTSCVDRRSSLKRNHTY